MVEAERGVANGEGRGSLIFCHETRQIGAGRSGVTWVLAEHVENVEEVEIEYIRVQQHAILTASGASALSRRMYTVDSRVSHCSMVMPHSASHSTAVSSASLLLREVSTRRRATREPPASIEQGEATRVTRHNVRVIRVTGGA